MEHKVLPNKKEAIMAAALEAYTRFGIHDATTRQIAEIAGIGKSTIFEYFSSSEELMDEAFAWYIGLSSKSRAENKKKAETDAIGALQAYFDELTQLILHEPGKLLLISQYVTAILASGNDFADVKKGYARKLAPAAESLLADFQFIVSEGVKAGAFRPIGGIDPLGCALMLSAVAREMQSQALVSDERTVLDTCSRLKRIAFILLGVQSIADIREENDHGDVC